MLIARRKGTSLVRNDRETYAGLQPKPITVASKRAHGRVVSDRLINWDSAMPVLTSRSLAAFINDVDDNFQGNLNHPKVVERYYPMEFKYSTYIDQELDPFSPQYFDQQIALYREITQRELDQWTGELHPVDVPSLVMTANPLGLRNVAFIAEHVRAISSMLTFCNLSDSPKILDLGAGHGLSSEVLAFCGCTVHAVDIDPKLSELSDLRAARRGLDIRRSVLSYDDLSSIEPNTYNAAFFFQSFHHSLKPWVLIETLKSKLVEGGVIAFTGEPIQAFWRNWGLRLDQESLYVARKFGWFESGWSHEFLRKCFQRSGFHLKFLNGGHGGGHVGIASTNASVVTESIATARRLGFTEYQTA